METLHLIDTLNLKEGVSPERNPILKNGDTFESKETCLPSRQMR